MKSAEGSALIRLVPSALRPQPRDALEFLPAALEVIETPPSPAGRAIGATIILSFVAALTWACLGKVDIVATASGRIIPSGKTKVIQPFETGVVRAIRVSDGQAVRTGEVLVELDPTASAADEQRLNRDLAQDRLDAARLKALLTGSPDAFLPPEGADEHLAATARQQMREQAEEQRARLAGLDQQIAGKRADVHTVMASIAKIEAALPMLREQRDIREQLLKNEFGSRMLYLQAEGQVVEQERELTVDASRLDEARAALAVLERRRGEAEAEYRKGLLADLAKAETAANEHGEEAVKAAQRHGLQTLKAPVDGTVQQLAVHTVGGVVTPAQPMMAIVPDGPKLEIEATLANKDVGFVHAGQPVEIKVETFSFTRYGLLHGSVTGVSRDVVAPEDGTGGARPAADIPRDDRDRQARQPAYLARIALAETGIATEQGWAPLEPGMAVTAEIKTGQRRVISYLLSPLARYRQEGLRER